MKYDVLINNVKVGTARTTGEERTKRRLINTFGTRATEGLADREEDCEIDIEWAHVDRLEAEFPDAKWQLVTLSDDPPWVPLLWRAF